VVTTVPLNEVPLDRVKLVLFEGDELRFLSIQFWQLIVPSTERTPVVSMANVIILLEYFRVWRICIWVAFLFIIEPEPRCIVG
jgi:hypothetical protein